MNLPSESEVLDFVSSDQNNWKIVGDGLTKTVFRFNDDFVISFLKAGLQNHVWTQLLIDFGLLVGERYEIPLTLSLCEGFPEFESSVCYVVEKLEIIKPGFTVSDFELDTVIKCLGHRLHPAFKECFFAELLDEKRSWDVADINFARFKTFAEWWKKHFAAYHQIIEEYNLYDWWDSKFENIGINSQGEIVLFDIINTWSEEL